MATILITGGTGLIGTALTKALVAKGYDVIILSRSEKKSSQPNISYAVWDVSKQTMKKPLGKQITLSTWQVQMLENNAGRVSEKKKS